MNQEQRIDAAVAQLEVLLPEFQAFGTLLSEAYQEIETKTFSHRHGEREHSMGLACFPAGSNELDAKCVSLIITMIDLKWLGIKGYVAVNRPPYTHEAETCVIRNPSQRSLQRAFPKMRSLLGPFRQTVQRELTTWQNPEGGAH